MSDVLETPAGSCDGAVAAAAGHAVPAALPLRFAGQGSEYFRIWIVNMLLILVTVGLYYPWAKVRRIKYFYNHTTLDAHALDFHGQPKRMLRGMLLVAALLFVYSRAAQWAPVAGVVAAAVMVVVWPLLWRSAMRFRLANTSWRGLRFQFAGSVRGAFLTVGLPLAAIVLPVALVQFGFGIPGDDTSAQGKAMVLKSGKYFLFIFLAFGLLLPWFFWLQKNYVHASFRFGQIRTALRVKLWSVYVVHLEAGVIMLAAMVAVWLLVFAFIGSLMMALSASLGGSGVTVVSALAVGITYLSFFIVMRAYLVARLQNLLWSNTGARWLRFRSELRFSSLLWMMTKNWIFIVCTLGFYWPFASVALWRARVEAVTVLTRLPPDALLATMTSHSADAVGDMAADLGDMDLGW